MKRKRRHPKAETRGRRTHLLVLPARWFWSFAIRQLLLALLLSTAITQPVVGEPVLGDPEERVIRYETADDLADSVALLQKRLDDGTARLKFEAGRGYLSSLLEALRIPVASQGLVFSKTSTQREHISPQTPRAVYFADDVSVAWVPGGKVIDLAAVDPTRGPVFYTLEQSRDKPPEFRRSADCVQCHLGPKTLNVPGLLVRSIQTASDGTPLGSVDGFVNGHNSALPQRWGGWYVTGTHRADVHLGNTFITNTAHPERTDPYAGGNVTDLRNRFDATRYLSPHSDLVALLVLEHQVRMQNLITRANYETRYALAEQASVAIQSFSPDALDRARRGDSTDGTKVDWPRRRIALAAEELLEYMLFRNEASLKGPVKGTSEFTAEFERGSSRDSKGRSLRQLDLQTRLFRYPCSFLIYSPAFDALPQEMKAYLWQRLQQILTGQDQSATYSTMTSQDRKDVLEILLETKPEFAARMRK